MKVLCATPGRGAVAAAGAIILMTLLMVGGTRPDLLAQESDGRDVAQGKEVAVRECGRCHQFESTSLGVVGSEVFRTQVREADFASLPLRSWLDIRHTPRVPVVHLSEADVDYLGSYLDWLRRDSFSTILVEEIEAPVRTGPRIPQVSIPLVPPSGSATKKPRCDDCIPAASELLNRP